MSIQGVFAPSRQWPGFIGLPLFAAMLAASLALEALATEPAHSAEPQGSPIFEVDKSSPLLLSVKSRNVPLRTFVKELGDRLHLQISGLSLLDHSREITGSFKSDVGGILHKVLPNGFGFASFAREGVIERIVIFGAVADANGGSSALRSATLPAATRAAPPAHQMDQPAARQVEAPPSTPLTAMPFDPLNLMLQTSLRMQQQYLDQSSHAVGLATVDLSQIGQELPTATSMAALTQAARANVQALGVALRSACVGANCAN